jgi:hypothetical protein
VATALAGLAKVTVQVQVQVQLVATALAGLAKVTVQVQVQVQARLTRLPLLYPTPELRRWPMRVQQVVMVKETMRPSSSI